LVKQSLTEMQRQPALWSLAPSPRSAPRRPHVARALTVHRGPHPRHPCPPSTPSAGPLGDLRRHAPASWLLPSPYPDAPARLCLPCSPRWRPALPWSSGQAPAAFKWWSSSSRLAPRHPRLRCQAAAIRHGATTAELPLPRCLVPVWAHLHRLQTSLKLPRPRVVEQHCPARRTQAPCRRRAPAQPHELTGVVLHPDSGPNPHLGEPPTYLTPLPALARRRLAGFQPPRRRPCRPCPLWTTLWGFIPCRGLNVKDRDLYVKKSIFRSIYKLQDLVNCTKNHKKL
jgi:hypothetical protein